MKAKAEKKPTRQNKINKKDKIDTVALATAIYFFLNLSCNIKIISYTNEYIGSLYKKHLRVDIQHYSVWKRISATKHLIFKF